MKVAPNRRQISEKFRGCRTSNLLKNAIVAFFNLAGVRGFASHGSQNYHLRRSFWHHIRVMEQAC